MHTSAIGKRRIQTGTGTSPGEPGSGCGAPPEMGRGTLEAGVVRLLRHGGPASLDHLAARAQEVRKRLLRGRPTPLVCREREGPDASRETNE